MKWGNILTLTYRHVQKDYLVKTTEINSSKEYLGVYFIQWKVMNYFLPTNFIGKFFGFLWNLGEETIIFVDCFNGNECKQGRG